MTGLTSAQAAGDGWLQALHRHDRERVLKGWETPSRKPKDFADELRFRAPDGAVRLVYARVLPLHDETQNLSGYLCTMIEVSERHATDQTLRKLTGELRQRVKELNCLFSISRIVERSGGSLPYILQDTVKLLPSSWEHSDIACARIVMGELEVRSEQYSDTPWRQQAEIAAHGEPVGIVEVCYLEQRPTRDEGPFAAEERYLISAIAERLGRVAERLQTEQLLAERERELRDRLRHLTRVSVMGEMASGIAHEVNQPLTAVATYAQAGKRMVDARMADSALVSDVLERISAEALRAGDIVHRLRNLVQKREAKQVLSDINKLIEDLEHLASVDARMHDVKLLFDLASPLPPVLVDEIQIQQVLLNLIRNGIDAMENVNPEDKRLIVRTRQLDNKIEISITDYGCGLPEDAEHKLFQPFFTTKKSGMGMGLSISRSIVHSHGGNMTFEANADRGATFSFTLPAA
jgi:PAS domain S-box-containing protein